MAASNYGEELRSGNSSPSFDEWGIEGNSRESFEPVPLFDSNSDESVGTATGARTQHPQYDNTIGVDPSAEPKGEKRTVDTAIDISMEGMPPISRRKKKAKGMPKRPMSSYALFFSRERSKLIDSEGDPNAPNASSKRLSFEELERIIGMRWRDLSAVDRKEFEVLAAEDSVRFRAEMEGYEKTRKKQQQQQQPPPQQPQPEPMNEPPPVLPPPHSSSMHHHRMAMYMPPPSPSSARTLPPPSMYGGHQHGQHPQHPPPRHSHPHHPEHYPQPYPPMSSLPAHRYPNEPPPHYYAPPVVSSAQHGGGPLPAMRTPSLHPPPPHPVPSATMDRDLFPIPPGMELMLQDREGRDRKYKVEYACYTMTREAAQEYVERLSSAISHGGPPPPPPPQNPRLDDESDPAVARRPRAWSNNY